ncbi:hypothetical protein [Verrucomicrobium spinosum]|uniref:hypothetical protein n=1 Tax=Verrucomicrobium spinosum TaxID=2736 RepID=UPI0001744C06|nr:hypothetical protein [Verrucomicrobium spinosum]
MKLSDIFHSFGSRIAALKKQGKVGEARALILERDKSVTQAEAPPPVASTPSAPTPAPAVTAKPTSAPAPVAVDHSATIGALQLRLSAMEKDIAALRTENATLKASVVAPAPQPAAKKAVKDMTDSEKNERLAELAHGFDQCNTKFGRKALWTLHKEEIRALTDGPRIGWMAAFTW